jgi:hypothetical protein
MEIRVSATWTPFVFTSVFSAILRKVDGLALNRAMP